MPLATAGPEGSSGSLLPVSPPESLEKGSRKNHLHYAMSDIDTGEANRLALIITRLDSEEALDFKGKLR